MSNGTKVVKRNGRVESLNLEKMHIMVEEACSGLAGVSASQVEMTSGIQFYDGISTKEIQEILIRSASDLIDLDHPNYQYVAARLLLFAVRKQLYGKMRDMIMRFIRNIPKKKLKKLILTLIMTVTIFSLMRVYVRSLISTSCRIEALEVYMKLRNLCT
jgi:hypothetical protein